MSTILGNGITSENMPKNISVSDFGGMTPQEYVAAMAAAFSSSGSSSSHGVAQLSSSTVGSTVHFSNWDWIVAHNYGDTVVLVGKDAAAFGRTSYGAKIANSTYGVDSRIDKLSGIYYDLAIYESRMSSDDLNCCATVEISGIEFNTYRKLRLGTYNEANGGLSYFSSDTSRKYYSSTANSYYHWWLDSIYGEGVMYYVDDNGVINGAGPGNAYWIRPFVTVYIA